MFDIIDFGENCLPYFYKLNRLNLKQKMLFTLGVYNFNDIFEYLKNQNYDEIYKKENLYYENKIITNFSNNFNNYSHSKIKNKKCNFLYLHHFEYDLSSNTIQNYNFIVDDFKRKIIEFNESLNSSNDKIFLNFTKYIKIDELKINEMLSLLDIIVKHKYYIFIFFYGDEKINEEERCKYEKKYFDKFNSYDNIKVFFLKENFNEWWNQDIKNKDILCDEINNYFLNICTKINIIL